MMLSVVKLPQRLIAALLVAVLAVMFIPTYTANAATEKPWNEKRWYDDALAKCVKYGVLDSAEVDVEAEITRGEFCNIVNRAFNFYETTGARVFSTMPYKGYTSPYENDMLIASARGYLVGPPGSTKDPNSTMTREQAIAGMANIFLIYGDEAAATEFDDDAEISSWARGYVNGMIDEGYLRGQDISGKAGFLTVLGDDLRPNDPLMKSEAIRMVAAMFGDMLDKDNVVSSHEPTPFENLTLRTPGVKVENVLVKGDLFITCGVADGDMTLKDVTVLGATIINGGGSNSVTFDNCKLNTVFEVSPHKTHAILNKTSVADALYMTETGKLTFDGSDVIYNRDTDKVDVAGAVSDAKWINVMQKDFRTLQHTNIFDRTHIIHFLTSPNLDVRNVVIYDLSDGSGRGHGLRKGYGAFSRYYNGH